MFPREDLIDAAAEVADVLRSIDARLKELQEVLSRALRLAVLVVPGPVRRHYEELRREEEPGE